MLEEENPGILHLYYIVLYKYCIHFQIVSIPNVMSGSYIFHYLGSKVRMDCIIYFLMYWTKEDHFFIVIYHFELIRGVSSFPV